MSERVQIRPLLAALLGGASEASAMLAEALAEAGLEAVPEEPTALYSFVRGHISERIAAAVGPRVAMAMVDDMRTWAAHKSSQATRASQTFERSGVQEKKPEIALVDADRFARASLARLLVQGGAHVTVCESLDELVPECLHATVVVAVHARRDLLTLARLIAAAPRATRFVILAHIPAREIDFVARGHGGDVELVPGTTPIAALAAVVFARAPLASTGR